MQAKPFFSQLSFLITKILLLILPISLYAQSACERPTDDINAACAALHMHYGELLDADSKILKSQFGTQPIVLSNGQLTDEVYVLIHGLIGTPYYMLDIANSIHEQTGANIVLPLLTGHGYQLPATNLTNSVYTTDRLYRSWQKDVDNAVEVAKSLSTDNTQANIIIGGLSMGGILAVDKISRDDKISYQALLLFSPALSIDPWHERLVHYLPYSIAKKVAIYMENKKLTTYNCEAYPGIGYNPYRYPMMTDIGGFELLTLLKKLWQQLEALGAKDSLPETPTFIAYSRDDEVITLTGINRLIDKYLIGSVELHIYKHTPPIAHAEVVWATDLVYDSSQNAPACVNNFQKSSDIEKANPYFERMMDDMFEFLGTSNIH